MSEQISCLGKQQVINTIEQMIDNPTIHDWRKNEWLKQEV